MNEPTTQKPEPSQELLTLSDVAKSLHVSSATALRWIHSKKLEGFFQIGRKWLIRKGDFQQFLANKATINN